MSLDLLLTPFFYDYMFKAIWVSALVGAVCAFLSAFLIIKGWSLMGDAMSHSVVPGVILGYIFKFSYVIGAFSTGILAAVAMFFVKQKTKLKEDVVIGIIFTAFFALGLFLLSLYPLSISIESIIMGNILAISDEDVQQVILVSTVSLAIMTFKWRDLMLVFFDETQARMVGIPVLSLKMLFFALLSACTVAALQTVGAILVVAMVITPGATAYLLTDRFSRLTVYAVFIGFFTAGFGAYISFFMDGATGGIIVCLQTILFFSAFLFAPKYGLLRKGV